MPWLVGSALGFGRMRACPGQDLLNFMQEEPIKFLKSAWPLALFCQILPSSQRYMPGLGEPLLKVPGCHGLRSVLNACEVNARQNDLQIPTAWLL